MQSVTVSRWIDADPGTVRAAIDDVGPFMRAAEFDEVVVEGDRVSIENTVGIFEIELDLRIVEDADATLVYEQVDGIFREMRTSYRVAAADGGTEVTATTDFAVAARFVGPVFDATVVKRQRRREIEAQFDYLESVAAGTESPTAG